jgi:hypothetical protein
LPELDFNLRQLMTHVNEKTCNYLKTKSLAFGHNKQGLRTMQGGGGELRNTRYNANTLQNILHFFHWVQQNGNNFAHTDRPAVAALDDTLKTFNRMLEEATTGSFPNVSSKNKRHNKLPPNAIMLIREMVKEVEKDLKNG